MAGLHPSLWVPSWEGQPCREEGGWQAQRSGTLSCHPLFGTLWLTASFLRPCPPCPCPPRADVRGWGGRWTAQLGQGQALPSTKQPSVFPSPASPAVSLSLSLSPPRDERQSQGVGKAVQIAGRVPGAASAAWSSGLPGPHTGRLAPPNVRSLKLAKMRGTLGWGRGFG